jgi:hypothetical protein
MVARPDEEVCPRCGSADLERLMSRFLRGRDEDARLDEFADAMDRMGEPESPTEMREAMKELGRAMDEDYSDEMEEMFEADPTGMETGE